MQAPIAFQCCVRGNMSSSAATKWLAYFTIPLVGTIIFNVAGTYHYQYMKKFFKGIKTISIAMVNICLLCGAGHAFEGVGFAFKRTTNAGRKLKRYVLNLTNISVLNKR